MLKKKAINRIFFTTIIFFIVFILYSLIQTTVIVDDDFNSNSDLSYVYTLNNDNYVSKASVYVSKTLSLEDRIREKLEIMVKENNKNALLPSYFNPILPNGTKIEDVKVEDEIVKVYFSVELLDITFEQSEKMIESIVYTITDENILGIEIYVDGKILKYVPHTNKKLPTMITKDFGINKKYDISSVSDIVKVSMIYFGVYEGEYYEIPVTKYINDDREKLEVVFEELSNVFMEESLINLIEDVEILSYEILRDKIVVNFNRELSLEEEYIFLMSIFGNYDVEKVEIFVKNEKKSEKFKKDIEN